MISKLPRWAWFGAWALAFVAGIVNVVGLLSFEHQAVTHLTGTTSMLAVALASLDGAATLRFAAVIGAFLVGAVLSGFLVQDSTLRLGRSYGIALLGESFLLCAAVPLLERNSIFGIYAAACACGLQNAMVSAYSGAVVRTTHLSGMFTDLGIFVGHFLRGLPVDQRRLRLCVLIITGFLCGGVAGAAAFRRFGIWRTVHSRRTHRSGVSGVRAIPNPPEAELLTYARTAAALIYFGADSDAGKRPTRDK